MCVGVCHLGPWAPCIHRVFMYLVFSPPLFSWAGPSGNVEETTLRRLLYLFHSLTVMASEVRDEDAALLGPGIPASKVWSG